MVNNMNPLTPYSDEWLATVSSVVEANSFEHLSLWQKFKEKVTWKENNSGLLFTLGKIENRPICICLNHAIINDKIVLFFEATSQLVDYIMIDEFFKTKCPHLKRYWDAQNFHNAI